MRCKYWPILGLRVMSRIALWRSFGEAVAFLNLAITMLRGQWLRIRSLVRCRSIRHQHSL